MLFRYPDGPLEVSGVALSGSCRCSFAQLGYHDVRMPPGVLAVFFGYFPAGLFADIGGTQLLSECVATRLHHHSVWVAPLSSCRLLWRSAGFFLPIWRFVGFQTAFWCRSRLLKAILRRFGPFGLVESSGNAFTGRAASGELLGFWRSSCRGPAAPGRPALSLGGPGCPPLKATVSKTPISKGLSNCCLHIRRL